MTYDLKTGLIANDLCSLNKEALRLLFLLIIFCFGSMMKNWIKQMFFDIFCMLIFM